MGANLTWWSLIRCSWLWRDIFPNIIVNFNCHFLLKISLWTNVRDICKIRENIPISRWNIRTNLLFWQFFIWILICDQLIRDYLVSDDKQGAGVCLDIPRPRGGSVSCSTAAGVSHYKNCEATCNPGSSVSVPTPNFYTCGPQGTYNVANLFKRFTPPACAGMYACLLLSLFLNR